MAIEDNHNHFCIYCGARIDAGQNFCSECGKPVYRNESELKKSPSEYDARIDELEQKRLKNWSKSFLILIIWLMKDSHLQSPSQTTYFLHR